MRKPELLIPARSLNILKTAVIYGADAVYIGGEVFSLRAGAENFSLEQMREGIAFAHERGVKVYVTANIFAHNHDLEEVKEYLLQLKEIRPDAVIVSDPGVFSLVRELVPQMEIHISTQANSTNYETYRFWYRLGAKRVVSARELSLDELKNIRRNIPEDMEIETFIHGAMCISYSGRCLLSNYFTGRDANRGACTHPCRWQYAVAEQTRPGEYLPVEENERGTFIFNSKDLCMIKHIPDLLESGIDSFKVEGRMKNALYVAVVARTYRRAIDDFLSDPKLYEKNLPWYEAEIQKCTTRQFCTGFFYGAPAGEAQIYGESTYYQQYIYLGTVEHPGHSEQKKYPPIEPGAFFLLQKNKFSVGETIEIMKPDGRNIEASVLAIWDEKLHGQESAPHARQPLYVKLSEEAEQFDILRKKAGKLSKIRKV